MSHPLILLDVDGPLNPYSARGPREGYVRHNANRIPVWLNPLHGPRLLKLAEDHDAELAWATTWEHLANEYIGPHIGLPKLPVITFDWGFTSKWYHWKWRDVAEYAAGRPLAWFDDDFELEKPNGYREFQRARGESPTLLHLVSPRAGLLERDFQAVEMWLADQLDRSTLIPGSGVAGPIRDTENGEAHEHGADLVP